MPAAPSEAITIGIAERSGRDETELPPLYDVIDPDALDAIVERGETCRVTFRYAGYEVTVDGPDSISIHETVDGLTQNDA